MISCNQSFGEPNRVGLCKEKGLLQHIKMSLLVREGAKFIGLHQGQQGGGAKSFWEEKNDGANTFSEEKMTGQTLFWAKKMTGLGLFY